MMIFDIYTNLEPANNFFLISCLFVFFKRCLNSSNIKSKKCYLQLLHYASMSLFSQEYKEHERLPAKTEVEKFMNQLNDENPFKPDYKDYGNIYVRLNAIVLI